MKKLLLCVVGVLILQIGHCQFPELLNFEDGFINAIDNVGTYFFAGNFGRIKACKAFQWESIILAQPVQSNWMAFACTLLSVIQETEFPTKGPAVLSEKPAVFVRNNLISIVEFHI